MKPRCPICRKIVKVALQSDPRKAKYHPFCSSRCKLVDLGSWLDARYRIRHRLPQQPPENIVDDYSETLPDK
jgi:endogenous inhibitor of DNA gyrase (YacG/DUF329 family)